MGSGYSLEDLLERETVPNYIQQMWFDEATDNGINWQALRRRTSDGNTEG